ncbi:hypothetical protein I9W82_002494 [Candida metapsilosis]|uniref:Mug135-like C-terminal domain-containing protein n=1 Tax=Candida metapsilosis TaxID=273372 RepID=A0A8H7ZEZ7_9ASCO|nr:hypothetical protein I9W82_002494 [Candida metapsilosis]
MFGSILPKVNLKSKRNASVQEDEVNSENKSPEYNPTTSHITTTTSTTENQRRSGSTSPSMRKKLLPTRRKHNHSRTSSVTFPDGAVPEEYGLPPIDKTTDVDYLQRFEVIRYLDAFNISHTDRLGEEELRTMLKETLDLQQSTFV